MDLAAVAIQLAIEPLFLFRRERSAVLLTILLFLRVNLLVVPLEVIGFVVRQLAFRLAGLDPILLILDPLVDFALLRERSGGRQRKKCDERGPDKHRLSPWPRGAHRPIQND